MRTHIFIETSKKGTNEWNFINQYVRHLLPAPSDTDFDIIPVGGKDKLCNFAPLMRGHALNEERDLVIFDCDTLQTGGGLERRRSEMESMKKENGVDFDLFLFPNDHDEGTFETLLLSITNPRHKGLTDCFTQYEKCVGGQNGACGGIYETPNEKAKIYAYITTFKRSGRAAQKVKAGDWDFLNPEYWDLDSPALGPLKTFLLRHLAER